MGRCGTKALCRRWGVLGIFGDHLGNIYGRSLLVMVNRQSAVQFLISAFASQGRPLRALVWIVFFKDILSHSRNVCWDDYQKTFNYIYWVPQSERYDEEPQMAEDISPGHEAGGVVAIICPLCLFHTSSLVSINIYRKSLETSGCWRRLHKHTITSRWLTTDSQTRTITWKLHLPHQLSPGWTEHRGNLQVASA